MSLDEQFAYFLYLPADLSVTEIAGGRLLLISDGELTLYSGGEEVQAYLRLHEGRAVGLHDLPGELDQPAQHVLASVWAASEGCLQGNVLGSPGDVLRQCAGETGHWILRSEDEHYVLVYHDDQAVVLSRLVDATE